MPDKRVYGYTRVSTDQQRLDRGISEIKNFCNQNNYQLHEIITDKVTGKNFDRNGYRRLRNDLLRSGDILIIPEMTRLGRTFSLINQELNHMKEIGVRVMILEIPTTCFDVRNYDGSNDAVSSMILQVISDVLIQILAVFAEVELKSREKRQREGIQQAAIRASNGSEEWSFGRPLAADESKFKELYNKYSPREKSKSRKEKAEARNLICSELNISRSTYMRYEKYLLSGDTFRKVNYEKWLPDSIDNEELI